MRINPAEAARDNSRMNIQHLLGRVQGTPGKHLLESSDLKLVTALFPEFAADPNTDVAALAAAVRARFAPDAFGPQDAGAHSRLPVATPERQENIARVADRKSKESVYQFDGTAFGEVFAALCSKLGMHPRGAHAHYALLRDNHDALLARFPEGYTFVGRVDSQSAQTDYGDESRFAIVPTAYDNFGHLQPNRVSVFRRGTPSVEW